MPVIESFKCGLCKRARQTKAEAERCEQLHEDCKPILIEIKEANNMDCFLKSCAKMIEAVCGVKVMHVLICELDESAYNQIEGLQVNLVLGGEPSLTNFKELKKINCEFVENQGQWSVEMYFNGPDSYYAWRFNKNLCRYLQERSVLSQARNNSWHRKDQVKRVLEKSLSTDAAYQKLCKELTRIQKEIDKIEVEAQKQVEEEFSTSIIDAQIKGLDMDWISMPVIF